MSSLPVDLNNQDHDVIDQEEEREQIEAIKRSLNSCRGKPMFDRSLISLPTLVALKHVMNITPHRGVREPIKYTDLPEMMKIED